jgi:hypothetical protein
MAGGLIDVAIRSSYAAREREQGCEMKLRLDCKIGSKRHKVIEHRQGTAERVTESAGTKKG